MSHAVASPAVMVRLWASDALVVSRISRELGLENDDE